MFKTFNSDIDKCFGYLFSDSALEKIIDYCSTDHKRKKCQKKRHLKGVSIPTLLIILNR